MIGSRRNKLVAAGAALAATVSTAGALAHSGALSPSEESEAVVNDAAEQLGVEPAELTDALKQALKNRVDAAVEAGRLTEEQGAEIKERIDAGEVPLIAFGPGLHGLGHPGHFGGLEAAASFLGMSEDELRSSLADGKTLAELAEEKDKTVRGLVDAMVAAAKEELNRAVEDGRLTDAQRDEISSRLEERITATVNGELRRGPHMHGHGRWGPPPAGDSGDGSRSRDSFSGAETAVASPVEDAPAAPRGGRGRLFR
jgi:hypothetical protein